MNLDDDNEPLGRVAWSAIAFAAVAVAALIIVVLDVNVWRPG